MASSFTSGRFQGFDSAGNPLAGGQLWTYAAGTLTPLATFTTQSGGVANANPVVLDSAGRAPVWLSASSYRMVLKTAAGVTVTDDDNISPYPGDTVTFIAAGTGAVTRTMQDKARDAISVFDFFPSLAEIDAVRAGTSTLDSTPYILLAANYAAPKDIDVVIPGGTLLMKSTLALTTAHNNLTFRLQGATLKKAFNGTLCTVTGTSDFSVDGSGVIDGDGATYTGKGFSVSGAAAHRTYFGPGVLTTGFADNHFYFGPDAGFQCKIMCDMTAYSGQASNQAVLVDGPDTQAIMRSFWGTIIGHITLTGALSTIVRCPIVNRVETDAASDVVVVAGVVWANNGSTMTLNGGAMIVTGCRFSGGVVLSSSMSGSFIGNVQTSGTFTNSTVGGNCLVNHHPLSVNYSSLAKHSYSVSLTQSELQLNQVTSMSDADDTWTPDTTATTRYLAVSLTANRTVTLSTSGARAGMVARFSRPGGNTAGPWTLTLGSTGVALATKQWADVMYNGSAWVCVAFGSLP